MESEALSKDHIYVGSDIVGLAPVGVSAAGTACQVALSVSW